MENCLHFYFDHIGKYPNQKINLQFIDESIARGVDINYLDSDYVTILAKVNLPYGYYYHQTG